ncbi:hypothetical protein JCM16303_002237 [Sporobolomyces ruberrimus]
MDLGSIATSLARMTEGDSRGIARTLARVAVQRSSRRQRRKRTGIADLPDELLLKIFSQLDDEQGFRPLSRSSSNGTEWYSPPLRIGLVCKRWQMIAQHLFYRVIKIHHLERISSLHEVFATTTHSLFVRHLSIILPYARPDRLALPVSRAPSASVDLTQSREADSDSDAPSYCRGMRASRPPATLQDQLRWIFQSCSRLLSLEISGVNPDVLFSSSSAAASLHHLHQLRLSTVSSLTLKGGFEPNFLIATTLRQALLALTGLRTLAVKGYVSDLSSPLDFAPTCTARGSPARPLPSRARPTLSKLEALAIIESAMSPQDLENLLLQVQPGTLEEFVIKDAYDSSISLKRREEGKYDGTTVEGLSGMKVGELVRDSLKTLRVTLHNHPLARDALALRQSSPPLSTRRQLSGSSPPSDPPYILDHFISNLRALETLDLGGSLVSSALLGPTTQDRLLPSNVRHLTIRACPALTPAVVLPFLQSLSPSTPLATPMRPRRQSTSASSRLSILEIFGGSESGWKDPVSAFRIQQACWDANVRWRGGGEWSSSGGGGGSKGGGDWREGGTVDQSICHDPAVSSGVRRRAARAASASQVREKGSKP